MSDVLEAALSYAARGWAVLPLHGIVDGVCTCSKADFCTAPGKHPTTINGVKDATRSTESIRAWFSGDQNGVRNVAIATGSQSGVVVLDVDDRHGGADSLRVLEYLEGRLPTTLKSTTGAGSHLFFRHSGLLVPNSVGTLGEGLDIRGDGGYVCAAPSLHVSGVRYAWVNPGCELADLPPSLGSKVKKKPQKTPEQWQNLFNNPIKNGQRHVRLCEVAGKLLRSMDEDTALSVVLCINDARCTPPLDHDEVEALVLDIHRRYFSDRSRGH